MNRVAIAILVVAVSLSAFGQTSKRKPSPRSQEQSAEQKQQFADDQQAINALHDKDVEASIALDGPALESLWTDDIVSIHPGAPAIVGRDANAKRLQQAIDDLRSTEILAYNEEFQEVHIVADTAYEWGTITSRTRPMKGGAESNYRLNLMRILRREPDGSWKIARSIYNDATPAAPQQKVPEPAKPDDKNKLKE